MCVCVCVCVFRVSLCVFPHKGIRNIAFFFVRNEPYVTLPSRGGYRIPLATYTSRGNLPGLCETRNGNTKVDGSVDQGTTGVCGQRGQGQRRLTPATVEGSQNERFMASTPACSRSSELLTEKR